MTDEEKRKEQKRIAAREWYARHKDKADKRKRLWHIAKKFLRKGNQNGI